MSKKASNQSTAVQDCISKLDVDLAGIASIKHLKGTKLEEQAIRLLPEAKSIVVFAMEVYPEILDHNRPERKTGHMSLNDLLDRHQEYLNGRLTKAAYDVAKISRVCKLKAMPLPAAGYPVDGRFLEAVFSYKDAAQAAGLGSIGRSSLLITPDFGPRVRLACCLTEARLEPSKALKDNACSGCGVCIKNCPSKALKTPPAGEPYAMNKFACFAFRNAAGACSECVRLCPVGR